MNRSSYIILIYCISVSSILFTGCKKTENPIKYPKGIFPETLVNLTDINSEFDDYNLALYQITGNSPIIFSSNRKSSGGQFDLEQASLGFTFDQTNGNFNIEAAMTTDPFLEKLITKATTSGNDFGPYRFFSSIDGYEYLLLSSVNGAGDLDLYYLKNLPAFGTTLPEVNGPFPIKLLNTDFDDAYLCFDSNFDSAYFCSNRYGNFDIFLQPRPAKTEISSWFNLVFAVSTPVDSLNSVSDDKCPFVFRKIMVFTSNRPGGFGGYDLYYSILKNANWSSPVNLGSVINSSSDEYRPIIGYHPDFKNLFMMFSSNRPGGKGGFDLYFTGVNFPE